MSERFKNILVIFFIFFAPSSAFARCAICYTNGLSGASIALMVIIISFIVLFFANKFLNKFLEKE